MNAGVVSSRYAEALLKFVRQTGGGQLVYEQAVLLARLFMQLDGMRAIVEHPNLILDTRKFRIFVTALGGVDKAAPEMKKFLKLVMRKRRTKLLILMLWIFIDKYRHEHNIHVGKLTLPVENEELKERLIAAGRERTGGRMEIETKVDPSIIGGFIFDIEGLRLDASVSSALANVRKEFKEKNRRII